MRQYTAAECLVRWLEWADEALNQPGRIPEAVLIAWMARPEAPGKATHGVTYYLQQQIQTMREQERDKMPDVHVVGEYRFEQWRERRRDREARIEGMMMCHNEAMSLARAFVEQTTRDARKPRTRPSVESQRVDLVRAALATESEVPASAGA